MSEIDRWNRPAPALAPMLPHPDGKFVEFTDHERVVAEARSEAFAAGQEQANRDWEERVKKLADNLQEWSDTYIDPEGDWEAGKRSASEHSVAHVRSLLSE